MDNVKLFRQSGRRNLPKSELRTRSVNVRLNDEEMSILDAARGKIRRAEALRIGFFTKLPAPIPEINSEVRAELGKLLGNVTTLATAMRGGDFVELEKIKAEIVAVRSILAGIAK